MVHRWRWAAILWVPATVTWLLISAFAAGLAGVGARNSAHAR